MCTKHYLVITPFFPSNSTFVGPYVSDQVLAIQRLSNFSIVVLKPKSFFSKLRDYDFEGLKVHYFRRIGLPSNILPGLFSGLNKYLFLKKLKRLGLRPDAVAITHAHVAENGFYAEVLKTQNPEIKTVLQHHGFDVLSLGNGILRDFKIHRNRVEHYGVNICNAMDLHVGVSQKTLNFVTDFKNIKPKETYVFYNGVDAQKFYPIAGLKDTNIFKIGCVANFWPLKDQMTLIKAAERLVNDGMTDLRVVFIGTGQLLETCKAYVIKHKLELYIRFEKEVKHYELNTFYNTLDLFVLPSYFEAFGCVYTEAYACGVPFIAVKKQGIAELIPEADKDKWLIEKGDYKALVQKIESFRTIRYTQKLNGPYEIDELTTQFLDKIKETDA